MQKEMNPTMTQHSLRTNPTARRKASNVWIRRTVRLFLTQPTSSANVTMTIGNVMAAYGAVEVLRSRILGIKAWNMTAAGKNSNYIRVTTDGSITTSGITMNAEDVGNSSSLPGVGVNIPDLLSAQYSANGSSTTAVALLTGAPIGNPTDAQTYCVDVNFAIQPV